MSLLTNLGDLLKKTSLTEVEFFSRNRNKKILAKTTLPTEDETKQSQVGL